MIFIQSNGERRTIGRKLDTADMTVIVPSVDEGKRVTLESILISCDATPTAISVWYTDGTTNFYLMNAVSILANDSVPLRDHHVTLRPGWSLRCEASAAEHLDITTVVVESFSNKGREGGGGGG